MGIFGDFGLELLAVFVREADKSLSTPEKAHQTIAVGGEGNLT